MSRDWDRVVEVAAAWIADQFRAAVDRAFPPGQLWSRAGNVFRSEDTIRHLRDFLEIEIDREFQVKRWPWDRTEPLRGSLLRVICVDGRFPHRAIKDALRSIGADEIIEHLPHGMSVVINPGRLIVRPSMREKVAPLDVSTWKDGVEAAGKGGR